MSGRAGMVEEERAMRPNQIRVPSPVAAFWQEKWERRMKAEKADCAVPNILERCGARLLK